MKNAQTILVIDAGHGGGDPGAIGPTGLHESDISLDLSQRVGALADAAGFEVLYTRYTDVAVPLADRAKVANRSAANAFVSIHCNAATTLQAHGYEVFTTRGQTKADRLADLVVKSIQSAFPDETLRSDLTDGDLDREANFQVLRDTLCPAILVETGFISHGPTETMMRGPIWRDRMALAIFNGIMHSCIPAQAVGA